MQIKMRESWLDLTWIFRLHFYSTSSFDWCYASMFWEWKHLQPFFLVYFKFHSNVCFVFLVESKTPTNVIMGNSHSFQILISDFYPNQNKYYIHRWPPDAIQTEIRLKLSVCILLHISAMCTSITNILTMTNKDWHESRILNCSFNNMNCDMFSAAMCSEFHFMNKQVENQTVIHRTQFKRSYIYYVLYKLYCISIYSLQFIIAAINWFFSIFLLVAFNTIE